MKNGRKILKGIIFILGFVILFLLCQRLLQAKWLSTGGDSTASTTAWIEYRSLEPDTVDVLYLGTSHTYCAVDPMYIYENSGITGFAFGGPGLRFDLTWQMLEEALKTQSPKVVFLDMSAIQFDFQQTEAKCHKISDQMPISASKLEYAFDNDSEEMKPLDILFPLFRYHSRWGDLTENDFRFVTNSLSETSLRGHYISYSNKKTKYHFYEECECVLTERNRDYVTRMAELCKKNNIDLILYKIPTPTWYESQSEVSAQLAEELGIPYLELFYESDKMGLNLKTDFKDKNNHLNQLGAEKFSDYMMKYLQEHYSLEDQRNSNTRWNEDLTWYLDKKEQKLAKSQKK